MTSAARRVLLVDHTKFSNVALHRLARLTDFDLVIVDSDLDEKYLKELREDSVPFKVAPV